MDRDDRVDAVREALEAYFRELDDLNDTDTDVLADNIVDHLIRKGLGRCRSTTT